MTADQAGEFLRMHFMAMTVGGILLRHRAMVGTLGAAVCEWIILLRKFGRYRAHVGCNHGQLLALN